MKDHYCDENLQFWKVVEEYRLTLIPFKRRTISKNIYEHFIKQGAENEVYELNYKINISHNHSLALKQAIEENGTDNIDIFDETQRDIFILMSLDTYPKFLEFIRINFL
ncbi:Regulator of G-protein signaling 4 [Thelohanellus kitauei]|uniref:Regulator of G-protein signaling 4 n=1 Tax=Thelohanellus kitauei TaxID=669202 RepID=A0A0C2N5Z0_THEKT|nr:Regulator of G-protein signaling 4 [Thelohanellus kitauei]